MKNLDNLTLEDLIDITTIKIDKNLSKEERIKQYIQQIKNPYCFKYKNFKVQICFNEEQNAKTLEECLTSYLQNL